ncbi:hypothetical protein NK214_13660 [Chromobacterium sp. S0633]|uniref:hypothetical protein n=1 Tax=Chromobacterium sp. S0633 TaxID=2957805 RepID=UPI00209D30F1|nr:hypothetical protein [Chromobacterium sp. S0633]MCP1291241.1 hypothetical protein [Chromobacterium sp. S0633]
MKKTTFSEHNSKNTTILNSNIPRMILQSFIILISSKVNSSNLESNEIKIFFENAQICEHLSGEVSGGHKAKAIDIKNANKYCGTAKRQRKKLLEKYKNDGEVIKVIREFDETLDPKH